MPESTSRYSFESIALDLSDCIGIESGVDLISNVDLGGVSSGGGISGGVTTAGERSGGGERWPEKMEKEFPPPIPWLARTENLPCFMKRYYTDDGRLVIVEEKVQRQDYFRADRSDGRLTLRLIPIKDDGEDVVAADEEEEDGGVGRVVGGEEGGGYDQTVVVGGEESIMATTNLGNGVAVVGNGGGGGAGGGNMYHQYCNLSRNSCMFGGGSGVAVAAVRSVHT
ncbi:OLC1v1017494C1 [Oldenlandia corymbosa var. corymbosa]|uniref:OLC1v1017494C1 n=1 Tax=Oldenlandia corymbosa var. corymbosa TaxID=529605 RepID=A0AAV1E9M1_OLDCO|nr:OLC1v1017494C1 [Oldenlandia corymbosa var. corymbosa]